MAFLQNSIAKKQTIIAAKKADDLFDKELSEKIIGLCARLVLLVFPLSSTQPPASSFAVMEEALLAVLSVVSLGGKWCPCPSRRHRR